MFVNSFGIAATRQFILKMRSITSPTAGSLVTGECRSFWLEDHFELPASATPNDISAFLAFWTDFKSIRQEIKKSNHEHSALRGSSCLQPGKLVFIHHDLAPRNLVLHPSGEIWLIDWDLAGFYPHYFEYAAMDNFMVPRDWGVLSRFRWYLFTWIAAGRSEKESRLLWIARSKFQRFGSGRRCNILAYVTKGKAREGFTYL